MATRDPKKYTKWRELAKQEAEINGGRETHLRRPQDLLDRETPFEPPGSPWPGRGPGGEHFTVIGRLGGHQEEDTRGKQGGSKGPTQGSSSKLPRWVPPGQTPSGPSPQSGPQTARVKGFRPNPNIRTLTLMGGEEFGDPPVEVNGEQPREPGQSSRPSHRSSILVQSIRSAARRRRSLASSKRDSAANAGTAARPTPRTPPVGLRGRGCG